MFCTLHVMFRAGLHVMGRAGLHVMCRVGLHVMCRVGRGYKYLCMHVMQSIIIK